MGLQEDRAEATGVDADADVEKDSATHIEQRSGGRAIEEQIGKQGGESSRDVRIDRIEGLS